MSLDEELIKEGYERFGAHTLNRVFVIAMYITDNRKFDDLIIKPLSIAKGDPNEPSDMYNIYIKWSANDYEK